MTLGITIPIKGDTSGLSKSLDLGGTKVTAFGKSIDLGGIAKLTAFGAIAGGVIDVLGGFAKAAADDKLAADQLAGAISAAGAATGDWQGSVEAAIKSGAALAFSDDDIRAGLTPLVGVTHDMARARVLLNEAQDIARLKNVDLATAAAAVAKAEGGQGTALAKLMQINATGKTSVEVLAEAQAKAAGQAGIYGNSTKGAGEAASIAMGELGETIGGALLPVIAEILPKLVPIISKLGDLAAKVIPMLMPVIGFLADRLGNVVDVLSSIIDFVAKVIDAFANVAKSVGDFIGSLNPLKDFHLPWDSGGGSGPGVAGAGAGGGVGTLVGGATLNVYVTGADPEAVVRALRRWSAVNGGSAALIRRVDGRG